MFTTLTKKSIQQYVSDLITERLKTALTKENEALKSKEVEQELNITDIDNNDIHTTEEEIDGFTIVKAIVRQKVKVSRITYRDAKSYFAIFLDDNNRKPICRLYLNGNKKFVSYFDDQKKEVKNEIISLDDIFKYSEQILNTITGYEK